MDTITFLVTNRFGSVPDGIINTVILTLDDWNDFSYYTLFGIAFYDVHGTKIKLGGIRIARFGQGTGADQKVLKINDRFEKLNSDCFSLGSDDEYYEKLNKLGDELRQEILNKLNDIAYKNDIWQEAVKEKVTIESLLRDVSFGTVTNQYRRIANGGARLTSYSFSYYFPEGTVRIDPPETDFNVIAAHEPSTNIQIIIGRNGVGKSHLLNNMIDSLLLGPDSNGTNGAFVFNPPFETETFSNLVCVTFSAFDEFKFHDKPINPNLRYHYVGLKNLERITEERKTNSDEFTLSLGFIISAAKQARWKKIIKLLDTDPIFRDENFADFIDSYDSGNLAPVKQKFASMSSGHKIILLTITKLVELLNEKSLVFFDEPETHLHPPLLSSFTRALSELLTDRNAVCIMTTHSPVVLQEVPKSCVLKLSRKGTMAKFEAVEQETFGENVGVLTNDVFGLEVMDSGFYTVLKGLVNQAGSYEEALQMISGKLGMEGRSILRSLFFEKAQQNEAN